MGSPTLGEQAGFTRYCCLGNTHPVSVMALQLFSNGIGRRKLGKFWMDAKDGDEGAREFFDDHYSRKRYADGREPKLFVGPGWKRVLVTEDGLALWAWRKYKSDDGQDGVNCAIFRNSGPTLSSLLILDAEPIAWERWPGERLFTYVDPSKVKSDNPGSCFIAAGWKRCGITKVNKLLIFEKHPKSLDIAGAAGGCSPAIGGRP